MRVLSILLKQGENKLSTVIHLTYTDKGIYSIYPVMTYKHIINKIIMKSEYRKSKEKKRVLVAYIVLSILVVSFFFFAGRVQKACIEANGVALCD